jgi:hypothetical protein
MYSEFYAQVGHVKEWGRLPSEFGLCSPEDDFALINSYCSVENTMKAYDAQLEVEEMERKSRRGRRK